MHDILQEMGKNIVIQESPNDAGRRSRLWSQDDIDHVLTKNSGSKLIEVIHLQSSKPYKASWDFEAFSAMLNLRILIISCDVYLPFGLRYLPNSLKILEWRRYPLKSLPLDVCLNELVDLKMHYSNIRQLWNGTQIMLQKLRFIDLSHSKDLIRSPDFSMLPNLEELVLEGCTELVEVHPSMGQHKKLVTMNLRNCKNLKVLPHRLEMDSLEKLLLTGCSKVKRLPVFGENMKCLSLLDLKGCTNLSCLPSSMGNLKSLRILIICGCSKIFSMPEDLDKNEFLEEIDVSGTAIRELPSNIFNLRNLKVLNLNRCTTLRSPSKSYRNLLTSLRKALVFGSHGVPRILTLNLPPSVSSLSSLNILKLSNCNLSARSIPDDLGCLASLQVLDLSGNNFSNIPAGSWVLPPSFSTLYSLRTLDLADCNLQDGSLPQDFACLSKLEYLRLSGNNFTILPTSCVSNLLHLRTLGLKRCPSLQKLPDLPPNVKFINSFTKICDSTESLSFPEELWKLIASPDFQVHFPHSLSHKGLFVFWNVIGSEIPSWFNNKSFHYRENVVGFRNGNIIQTPTREIMCQSFMDDENHRVKIVDSIVSMKVDVSHYCGSSENWGICVCLVVQGMEPSNSKWVKPFIWLSSKSCKDEFFEYESGWEVSSLCKGPQLFIIFLPSTYITVGSEHIELILFSSKFCVEEEANQLESNCESPAGKFIIIDCGWRVTSKEELEEWKKTSMSECNTSNLIEMHSESSVSKLWVTEAANGKRGCDESAETKPYISQRRRLI